MKFNIFLDSVGDVKKFVNIVNKYNCDITLTSGRYVVDAKSIMSIFSLDLSRTILAESENMPQLLLDELQDYIRD